MPSNMFEVLKIANKELVLSNYFAWLLNPEEKHGAGKFFLKEFLSAAGIETVKEDEKVYVNREFYFCPDDSENNFIDILLRFGNEKNPSRVICIENKIGSEEGPNQTKRYYDGLQKFFKDCSNKQFIYLTRFNSSVDLTNTNFIHVKYNQLKDMFSSTESCPVADKVPLVADFRNEYIVEKDFSSFKHIDLSEKDNFNTLLDALVYYSSNNTSDIFCAKGKSAKSGDSFCKIYKPSWVFSVPEYPDSEFCIHLEIVKKVIYLHFETKPYIPFSKIEEKCGEKFFNSYRMLRKNMREEMPKNLSGKSKYSLINFRRNADLQIAKFKIEADNYADFYESLKELIDDIDPDIQKIKCNLYAYKMA